MACSADHAINRLAELLVARLRRVFPARLLSADRHRCSLLPFALIAALSLCAKADLLCFSAHKAVFSLHCGFGSRF